MAASGTLRNANKMLSVNTAIAHILTDVTVLPGESVQLHALTGRIAASQHLAKHSHPSFSASAMDGYAVRFRDLSSGRPLKVVGEAQAGSFYTARVPAQSTLRIFTGAPVPDVFDHVIPQEHVTRANDHIVVDTPQMSARNIRPAGVDFADGEELIKTGERFHQMHSPLLAAANFVTAECVRKPRVAIISNGHELKAPGSTLGPGEIINSNRFALSELVQSWGGQSSYVGCALDQIASAKSLLTRAQGADIIILIGGASVGDYDVVRAAFQDMGGELVFEKVSMRPGKPTWFGRMGNTRVVGLPGNPTAAVVAATIFVQPLINAFLGCDTKQVQIPVLSSEIVPANGPYDAYLRAERIRTPAATVKIRIYPKTDTSIISSFRRCDCLLHRPPDAPACPPDEILSAILIAPNQGWSDV